MTRVNINQNGKRNSGFTLLEVLLVLVVISMVIYMLAGYFQQRALNDRMDRVATQMQQVLNAGLAYYVVNGSWPTDLETLKGNYLPPDTVPFLSPWGQEYTIALGAGAPPALMYVYTAIVSDSANGSATATANVIAGRLPLAYTSSDAPSGSTPPDPATACDETTTTCYVVSSVNIPGQNLNNASAVNFAGLYHHGACVPVPRCPVDANGNTMTPQIMVVPVSVSGVNTGDQSPVYPISSFTAYATSNRENQTPDTPTNTNPPRCTNDTLRPSCTSTSTNSGALASAYWRVCMQVVTQVGDVSQTNSKAWGQFVTVLAITRCAIQNEPSGSRFNVFGGN